MCGFEALLRWPHPTQGLIPPDRFIPIAEEVGLIGPIGAWVLEEACHVAKRWGGLSLAVNVSAHQVRQASFVDTVERALARSGLPAGCLELEITESVLLADSAATLATLHALRTLGAHISMDDFGTGYSSLSYLRSFPFDKIKIDRSFVQGATEEGSRNGAIRQRRTGARKIQRLIDRFERRRRRLGLAGRAQPLNRVVQHGTARTRDLRTQIAQPGRRRRANRDALVSQRFQQQLVCRQ